MMTDRIEAYMNQFHMWPENGHIAAGVSGGADSVCLLAALVRLRETHGLQLTVVHVDHGLRPEAGEDAAFVRELCRRWDVPFTLVREDVGAFAKREKISCEEAGRRVRYRAFAEALRARCGAEADQGRIAVAHNRDDRAETFLFRLFRGTGLEGMGGIRPVRRTEEGIAVIRPLLFAGREEIEAFLREEGIGWRTDATNAGDDYARNRIRNRILPYTQREINAGAKLHLAQEAALLEQTARFVRGQAAAALRRCLADGGTDGIGIDAAAFAREDPFLQDQLLYLAMERAGEGRDLTAAHVREMKKLFAPECLSGRRVELPACGVRGLRTFGTVRLEALRTPGSGAGTGTSYGKGTASAAPRETAATVAAPRGSAATVAASRGPAAAILCPLRCGVSYVPGLGQAAVRLLPGPAAGGRDGGEDRIFFENIPQKKYTKWLSYDKMAMNSPETGFRARRTGDYLTVDDALHRKSLKRYMIEEKIPADRRDKLVLLADGAHVVWLPGHRISAAYKVTAQTAVVLEITVLPEGDGGTKEEERKDV